MAKSDYQEYKLGEIHQKDYWEKGWKDKTERQQKVRTHWEHYINIMKERLKADAKIIEIGPGPLGMINYLQLGERWGLDPLMDYYLSNFDMPEEINWLKGIGESLPFKDAFFDGGITTDTLEHCLEPEKLMGEIKRVLKPEGILFLSVNTYSLRAKLIRTAQRRISFRSSADLHTFTPKQVESILRKVGFMIIDKSQDVADLEMVPRDTAERRESTYKWYLKRALEIKRQKGIKEFLRGSTVFLFHILFRIHSYENDSIFLATRPQEEWDRRSLTEVSK